VKKYVSNTPKVGHLLSYNGVSLVPDFQWLAREVDQEECMHSILSSRVGLVKRNLVKHATPLKRAEKDAIVDLKERDMIIPLLVVSIHARNSSSWGAIAVEREQTSHGYPFQSSSHHAQHTRIDHTIVSNFLAYPSVFSITAPLALMTSLSAACASASCSGK
jgi:hypothetical protein